jgi:hypothetical protein
MEALSTVRDAGSTELFESAASPPRKLRGRLPRSMTSKIVADYQASTSGHEPARKYEMPRSSVLDLLKREGSDGRRCA